VRSLAKAAELGVTAPTRIVCLPGAYHTPEDFLSAGFDTSVSDRGLRIDLLFVDAESRHLSDRHPLDQLKHDIVLPARALGYESIWLAGISLGGYMALDYATSNPEDLDGVCLLAPYLGNRILTGEIARSTGLPAPVAGELAGCDEERRIWRFIQAQHSGSRPLYLGYGREDRFAEAHRLMSRALPPDAVDVVPGGHDWRTWTTLWENFLDSRFT
jgi:pimeloyl-ACP methyl ester carboxylesterase